MDAEPGSRIELSDVLLVSDGDSIKVGSPTVAGAVVVAEVVEHGKGKKVINFKYKAKVRYRRKRGHRQGYTQLSVQEITLDGKTEKAPERRTAAGCTCRRATIRLRRPRRGRGARPGATPLPRSHRRSHRERRAGRRSLDEAEETETQAGAATPSRSRQRRACCRERNQGISHGP